MHVAITVNKFYNINPTHDTTTLNALQWAYFQENGEYI